METVWEALGAEREVLARAARDLFYLLGRSYRLESALRFVGNHYQLSKSARDVLLRCLSRPWTAQERRRRKLGTGDVVGRVVAVDTYNVLITVETALAGGILVQGLDRATRDVARVGGGHVPGVRTDQALALLSEAIARARPTLVRWFVDRPVSRSGSLAARIRGRSFAGPHEVSVVDGVDRVVASCPGTIAATSDAAILDQVDAWWDLAWAALNVWEGGLRIVTLRDLGLEMEDLRPGEK